MNFIEDTDEEGVIVEPPICAICGEYKEWVICIECNGNGGFDNEALMEEDPLWYEDVEWEECSACEGEGGHWECLNVPHLEKAKEEHELANS